MVLKGNAELGGFAGVVHTPEGTDAGFGGNVGYGLTRHIFPFFEFSVLPFASSTVRTGTVGDLTVRVSGGKYADVHGGTHVRFPIAGSRAVPYLVFGVGALRVFGGDVVLSQGGQTIRTTSLEGESVFVFNTGVGVRYYVAGDRWGLRGELTGYGPTGKFGGLITRATFGVFLQWGGE